MKKLRIDAIFFIIVMTCLGIVNLLSFNKPKVSQLENRALKQKPQFTLESLLSGSFFKDYEEYYSDTFIQRDTLVKANRDIQDAMSFLGPDVSLIIGYDNLPVPEANAEEENMNPPDAPIVEDDQKGGEPGNEPEPGTVTTTSPSPTPPEATPTPKPEPKDFGDGQNVGYWLVVDGQAVQLFKFNKESFEYYAQVINKFSEKLGNGVKIYSMIPPTAGEFLKLKKYKGITDSQNDALGFLESMLDDSITSINVYDALNRHKDEYIYFRTDHHWTALGAYYAYSSFMETIGLHPVALEQYEALDLGDFLGSSYTKTLDKNLEKNPDNFVVYKPFTENEFLTYSGQKEAKADVIDMKYADDTNNKYLTFISSGGATWSVIKTNVRNGKKLMLVKDSFGNALAPFLLPHYEEIYIVDPRFYSINATGKNIIQFVEEKGINEVVFCIYMEDVNWRKFMNSVENLLGEN